MTDTEKSTLEQLKTLDFNGEQMQLIKTAEEEEHSLAYYKAELTEFEAAQGTGRKSTEDRAAEAARHFYMEGYMQAVSMLTDEISMIIAKAERTAARA